MKEIMKAAFFEGNGILTLRDTPIPKLQREDELLLEVEVCSICGTDVHVLSVPPGYPMEPGKVLGHELVGKVIRTGTAVTKFHIGDRVVVNPNEYCGNCNYCLAGLPNHCENIIPMGLGGEGGFAEYIKVSQLTAHRIADDLPKNQAVFAEPLACAVNGLEKLRPNPGENALIIGAGPIGLIFLKLLKACGVYPIIVSESNPVRRELAKKLGADFTVDPVQSDLTAFVQQVTGGGADIAIDVVGSQIAAAVDCTGRGGKVLLFGMNTGVKPVVQQSDIVQKELTLYGTWLANATFPKAVSILQSGKVELTDLITHVLPFEKLPTGIELLQNGSGVEVIIDFSLK